MSLFRVSTMPSFSLLYLPKSQRRTDMFDFLYLIAAGESMQYSKAVKEESIKKLHLNDKKTGELREIKILSRNYKNIWWDQPRGPIPLDRQKLR